MPKPCEYIGPWVDDDGHGDEARGRGVLHHVGQGLVDLARRTGRGPGDDPAAMKARPGQAGDGDVAPVGAAAERAVGVLRLGQPGQAVLDRPGRSPASASPRVPSGTSPRAASPNAPTDFDFSLSCVLGGASWPGATRGQAERAGETRTARDAQGTERGDSAIHGVTPLGRVFCLATDR